MPNVPLRDNRPEGICIVIPQDDLYVITWETNFGDFESGRRNATNELPTERAENTSDAADIAEQPDQILTDVDLRSTRRDVTEDILPDQIMHEVTMNQLLMLKHPQGERYYRARSITK